MRIVYTVEYFTDFTGFQDISELDLHQFTLFFEREIANRRFTYITTHGKIKKIHVDFEGSHLPHLMSLQKWSVMPTRQAEVLYQMLLDGNFSMEYLQASDSSSYDSFKKRFELLPFLYQMLYRTDCEIKLVRKETNDGFQRRGVDMIFRRNGSSTVYLLELKNKGRDKFTFVPSSITFHKPGSKTLQASYLPLTISEVIVGDL